MTLAGQALTLLAAWLLGTLPSGLWLARWRGAPDPTRTGSGSSGATNVGRLLGWRWALVVLFLDLGKGVAAVALARTLGAGPHLVALCALLAVVGHCASPFASWKGGKGVATSAGAALSLHPQAALLALLPMVLVLLAGRRMAPASLSGVAAFALALAWVPGGESVPAGFAWILLALVAFTHRQNLDRLRRGVEPTLWGPSTGDPRWRSAQEEPHDR